MYPFVRMFTEIFIHRKAEPLPPGGTHVSYHTCMPWDLDFWLELNNGRALTLYDLGRIPFAGRIGLIAALRRRRWGLTMAGASVRYRRRVRMFQRFEMRSTGVGRDDRFFYVHQTMWRKGEAISSILYRVAVTDENGIVPTEVVAEEMNNTDWNPPLPDWVASWIKAEALRPWPPVDLPVQS